MKRKVFFLIISLACASARGHAEPAVWYVHPDSTLNSIQAALDACANNDIVLVATGTYVENIVWPHTQGIHLVGEIGPEYTIIDGDSAGTVITIMSGVDSTTIIRGFSIQSGRAIRGAGVRCENSSPTFQNLIISGNVADNWECSAGAGLYFGNSSSILENVDISDNHAKSFNLTDQGGGMCCWNSNLNLINVTISDNTAYVSGGGMVCDFCSPLLTNVRILRNHAWIAGGISCQSSSPILTNVEICGNSAAGRGEGWWYDINGGIRCDKSQRAAWGTGGGIRCDNSHPSLNAVTIRENSAYCGGGMYLDGNSHPNLTKVIIADNIAYHKGGGIFLTSGEPIFDPANRCNVMLNFAGEGCDLFSTKDDTVEVIVDTFTVLNPDSYSAYPIDKFVFDINSSKVQQVNQDLYVSPSGSNSNSGLTENDPLRTISYALAKIIADSLHAHTIYLAQGTYSPSQTNEMFPLNCKSFVSLTGEGESYTVLDGDTLSNIIYGVHDNHFSIQGMTIQHGKAFCGGGIYLLYSSPELTNISVCHNTAYCELTTDVVWGGGIYCSYSDPTIVAVSITHNSALKGGGLGCHYSSPNIDSCNISCNAGDGIYALCLYPTINWVNIYGNTGYAIYNRSSMIIDAENNWWGDSAGPASGSIRGPVDYDPWLTDSVEWVGVEEHQVVTSVEYNVPLMATVFHGPLRLPKGKDCRVFNITGRVVKPDEITPGVYFIEVDNRIVQKVVKVR